MGLLRPGREAREGQTPDMSVVGENLKYVRSWRTSINSVENLYLLHAANRCRKDVITDLVLARLGVDCGAADLNLYFMQLH